MNNMFLFERRNIYKNITKEKEEAHQGCPVCQKNFFYFTMEGEDVKAHLGIGR
jgi:hypothetical protein